MNSFRIRLASINDAEAINTIYNHYVATSTCTYQETEETLHDRMRWLADRDMQARPVTVAEANGQIVGFAALSSFHRRSAYRFTVENAVYVAHDQQCRGVGSQLLSDLLARAKASGVHSVVALIDSEQIASVALHRRYKFDKVGILKAAGFKFDRWLDVEYWQLLLPG